MRAMLLGSAISVPVGTSPFCTASSRCRSRFCMITACTTPCIPSITPLVPPSIPKMQGKRLVEADRFREILPCRGAQYMQPLAIQMMQRFDYRSHPYAFPKDALNFSTALLDLCSLYAPACGLQQMWLLAIFPTLSSKVFLGSLSIKSQGF